MRHEPVQVRFPYLALEESMIFHEGLGHFDFATCHHKIPSLPFTLGPLTIIREQGSQVKREELALASIGFEDDGQRLTEVARTA
jgi:hypothetical protein